VPTSIRAARKPLRTLLAAGAALLCVTVLAPAPSADASTLGSRAVSVAAAQKGKPYKWGATGSAAFDCSGLVVYVYDKRLHKNLPRTASAQRKATTPVAKSRVRPGDLIFFYSGATSNVTHVGVYAGGGKLWHSPKTGDHVKLSTLWTTKWTAGRVR
jgi:cell wall-associated NlpC family hydrolase